MTTSDSDARVFPRYAIVPASQEAPAVGVSPSPTPPLSTPPALTLAGLEAAGAPDFRRNDYARNCRLADLRTELEKWMEADDRRRYESDPETAWGFEGLSSIYAMLPDHPSIRTRVTHDTRLDDVRYRWLAVYPVTGANEGHYIHVDLIHQDGWTEWRTPLFLTKTFMGHAAAVQIAGALARLLGV